MVKTSEIFTRPELKLPIAWSWGESPSELMQERIDRFFSVISEVLTDAAIIQQARQTAGLLMKAFKCSLEGDVIMAHTRFHEAMAEMGDKLPISDESSFGLSSRHYPNIAFRMRKSKGRDLTKEDLFHIPFDKRFKVASERFSVLGAPCLYLGGSVFTCWEEMDRPPFHELQVSAFWVASPIRFVDLRVTPLAISSKLAPYLWRDKESARDEYAESQLLQLSQVWPLMALCMMKVAQPNGAFKPEYVIPQMTLHWIARNEKLDGVAYASCQTGVNCVQGITSLSNYAFPVRSFKNKGRCPALVERFRMTNPINCELLASMDLHAGERAVEYDIEVDEGVRSSSGETHFGRIERGLFGLLGRIRHSKVQNDGMVSVT